MVLLQDFNPVKLFPFTIVHKLIVIQYKILVIQASVGQYKKLLLLLLC